ncbi:heterodisulfide reductase, iron-sulfur binding subunit, putative [Olavius algarvensis associated proteobacterium Delta 3]|nr:heterodisulfide reductase, iron-sulfur binding subunit, putative [Olavius algarvensis associated proteobacterium Delta 3]CAB5135030.1 heterodisulfide reductase, iron-sulfur binding subunit, putative [Olavius algarvensis associated proteobacterium Delta 3]
MPIVKFEKQNWETGLNKLRRAYRLCGPVEDKGFHYFKDLGEAELPDFGCLNTRLSAKGIVYPQSEDMFEYSLDETLDDHHVMKDVQKDYSPRIVLGIRPCDAKAVKLVKLNFDTADYKDPYWLRAWEATTFVGLACDNPCSACFCTTAGCGPYHEEGLDVLLVDNDDHYMARVLTEKGIRFIETAGWDTTGVDGASLIEERRAAAEAKIVSHVSTDRLRGADTMTLHAAGIWEDISFSCINCGTCTFVCPTCWCFDIQDEVHGKQGKRTRNWDSCMFPIFTVHTTGHNPRGSQLQRVRQRFMHKLKYFVDKYDQGIMCVGCGRCVSQCPVNIDIRRVCELMNDLPAPDACAAQE